MRKLLKHWPLTLAALLALCCGLCVWRLWAVSNLLPSQNLFLNPNQLLQLNQK